MKYLIIIILFLFPIVSRESTPLQRNMDEVFAEIEYKQKRHALLIGVMYQETRFGKRTVTKQSIKEGAVGYLQIREGMVEYINRNLGTTYSLKDRQDSTKSVEMFFKFQERENPTLDLEYGCHIWNAGHNFVRERWHLTEGYRSDVLAFLRHEKLI